MGLLAESYQGVSLLDAELKTLISQAGADLLATVKDGGLTVAGVAVLIIAFTVGLAYVLRKFRSIGSQAV